MSATRCFCGVIRKQAAGWDGVSAVTCMLHFKQKKKDQLLFVLYQLLGSSWSNLRQMNCGPAPAAGSDNRLAAYSLPSLTKITGTIELTHKQLIIQAIYYHQQSFICRETFEAHCSPPDCSSSHQMAQHSYPPSSFVCDCNTICLDRLLRSFVCI